MYQQLGRIRRKKDQQPLPLQPWLEALMRQQQIQWIDRFPKKRLRLAELPPVLKRKQQGLEQPELEPEPEPEPEQLWLRCQ